MAYIDPRVQDRAFQKERQNREATYDFQQHNNNQESPSCLAERLLAKGVASSNVTCIHYAIFATQSSPLSPFSGLNEGHRSSALLPMHTFS